MVAYVYSLRVIAGPSTAGSGSAASCCAKPVEGQAAFDCAHRELTSVLDKLSFRPGPIRLAATRPSASRSGVISTIVIGRGLSKLAIDTLPQRLHASSDSDACREGASLNASGPAALHPRREAITQKATSAHFGHIFTPRAPPMSARVAPLAVRGLLVPSPQPQYPPGPQRPYR